MTVAEDPGQARESGPDRARGGLAGSLREAYRNRDIPGVVEDVENWIERSGAGHPDSPAYDHTATVNDYYDLCNRFMLFGWSESLQFAPLAGNETLAQAIAAHQRLMIAKLELQEGMRVVDVGCGFGALMRRLAREAGVRVVGINNNAQQLEEVRLRNRAAGLDGMLDCLRCNITDMSSVEAASFDRGYAIESTCYAPDRVEAFSEIFRLLKPGALFWGQEMCLTDDFDPTSAAHQSIEQDLMRYIVLKEIPTFAEVDRALESAGFEVLEGADRNGGEIPWYAPMEGRYGSWRRALVQVPIGRRIVREAIRAAEILRIFPRGSAKVIGLMNRTAEAYVSGGKAGIFTPLYCFLARKPH